MRARERNLARARSLGSRIGPIAAIVILVALAAPATALAEPAPLVRLHYQIDKDRGAGARIPVSLDLPAPVAAGACATGVGVDPTSAVDLLERAVDIPLAGEGLDPGPHTVTVWLEDAAGSPTTEHVRWFQIRAELPAPGPRRVELRLDGEPWRDMAPADPPEPCARVTEWSAASPSGSAPGVHELEVRLLEEGRILAEHVMTYLSPERDAFLPPRLRGDLPGEECEDGRDNDGDLLIDALDPECAGAPATVELAAAPVRNADCPSGLSEFELEVALDDFPPGPGDPPLHPAFVLAPASAAGPPPAAPAWVPLGLAAPSWRCPCGPDPVGDAEPSCLYDPGTRRLQLAWTADPLYRDFSVVVEPVASTAACDPARDLDPPPPGGRIDGGAPELETELLEAGPQAVRLIGWIDDVVALTPCPARLDVPFFCIDDLRVTDVVETGVDGEPRYDIGLAWRQEAACRLADLALFRDGTQVAAIPAGELAFLDQDLPAGTYRYQVRGDALAPSPGGAASNSIVVVVPSREGTFRRADCNDSGKVDLTDAVSLLAFLFKGGSAPGCPDACDAQDDGELDISDPISILRYLFLGGISIPAPGPIDCGFDPTPDLLGGCEASKCP